MGFAVDWGCGKVRRGRGEGVGCGGRRSGGGLGSGLGEARERVK